MQIFPSPSPSLPLPPSPPPRLVRDPRANYKQSLSVLEHAKTIKPSLVTKSSIMLGVGETDSQVLQALKGKVSKFKSSSYSTGIVGTFISNYVYVVSKYL